MPFTAFKVELKEILALRALFLQETNRQIRYNAVHERGWSDSYLLMVDDLKVGYGSINGQEIKNRDTVFEYFVLPPYRKSANELFKQLLTVCAARHIECQSNDFLLSSMLYEFSRVIKSEVILFEDHVSTERSLSGALVRPRRSDEQVFEHRAEPVGDYVLEQKGEVIATGGFLLHYNDPFADLYMEVREDCRHLGVGSYLVQELKKHCYLSGRVPAARCGMRNVASRATLVKAGLRVCGFMLLGEVESNH